MRQREMCAFPRTQAIRRLAAVALLTLVAALAGCAGQRAGSSSGGSAVVEIPRGVAIESRLVERGGGIPSQGDVAPDFAFTFANGETRRLSDLRGAKVVVNFWATWCAPCEEEMPDLQRLDERSDVVVLGVNRLELPEVIIPFARERNLTFTLIANPDGDIVERYGAKNIPISYFINSDGTIGYRQLGIMTFDRMQEQVDRLR
ncbi:alkyl hydroperoxide reductase/ Thiol specific antioxidant/ Mal allergen [Roseiflexus castenholzii DSM 13941]|uniref:Alkyl hydroperoxide reductase/ Thiol specific antioxidant/ Mal allergen n=2 Tax=Roseiflexus castenholzii TaxID=120962 RepID=A7NHK6_ROSCS|nr:alkyl hydroperoxide reductase/ Thiol specific antioxidant/ Mal allergen [Roseiflexus castenholzii DSM 13941]